VFDLYLTDDLPRSAIFAKMDGILSQESVRKYITQAIQHAKENGIAIRPRKAVAQESRSFAARKSISSVHVRVGAKLNNFRRAKDLKEREFSQTYKIGNQQSVREMELGFYDFSLSELNTIAAVIGTDVPSLLQQPGSNVSH
jgi:hypothetical protein